MNKKMIFKKKDKKSQWQDMIDNLSQKIDIFWSKITGLERSVKTSLIMMILLALSALILIFTAISSNVIPAQYLIIGTIIFILLCGLLGYLLFNKKRVKIFRVPAQIISGLFAVVLLIGTFYVNAFGFVFKKIQYSDSEKLVYSILLKNDNWEKEPGNLGWATIGLLANENNDTVKDMLKKVIEPASGIKDGVRFHEYSDIEELVDKFINKEDNLSAVCLDQAHLQLLSEEDNDFVERVKNVYNFKFEVPAEPGKVSSASHDKPFVIYLSAIDQYDLTTEMEQSTAGKNTSSGLLGTVRGKSEINRLIVVNPSTHKVLILNTPPEYYVQTGDSGRTMDKLSYAGIDGIQGAIESMERLYGVDIDYYVRLLYKDIVDFIDEIEGIDVDSGESYWIDSDLYVQSGINHFDGNQAMIYARHEAENSAGEAYVSGNQQRVFDAIFQKLISSDVVKSKFSVLASSFGEMIQTNMPGNLMTDLARNQLSDSPRWDIETYDLTGTVEEHSLYSLGSSDELSIVLVPDEASVSLAKKKIQAITSE